MQSPDATWLTVTNIILAVAVLALVAITVAAVIRQQIARVKKRRSVGAELDRDMKHFFGS